MKELVSARNRWNTEFLVENTDISVEIFRTTDLSSDKNYRPIIHLKASYKLFTGILVTLMKEHVMANSIWDNNQVGTCSNVLRTVDQLGIDK